MKVEIREKPPAEPTKKYPYIGIDLSDSEIVLFTDEFCGLTLNQGESTNIVGRYSQNISERLFKPFLGELVLSND